MSETDNKAMSPDDIQGDAIAAALAGYAEVYASNVLPNRRAATVDGYVLSALGTFAILTVTGPTSAGFKIMAHQLQCAADHVARVEAGYAARQAAQAAQSAESSAQGDQPVTGPTPAPESPMPPAAPLEPTGVGMNGALPLEHEGVEPVPGTAAPSGANALDGYGYTEPEHVPTAEEERLAGIAEADEAMAPDEDLLRWVLDPSADPWADLLFSTDTAQDGKRVKRSGVTDEMVQARFDRIHAILDAPAPGGVTKTAWVATRSRVLPVTYATA